MKNKELIKKKKILFVCLGNICRSPSAEAIMKKKVDEAGLSHLIEIDSAGITGYHQGDSADSRMIRHARERGYELTSISRQIRRHSDFKDFDYIIGMDAQNMSDLNSLVANEEERKKLHLMTDFSHNKKHDSVPDPYYGGTSGFYLVIDILEDACDGLLEHLRGEL